MKYVWQKCEHPFLDCEVFSLNTLTLNMRYCMLTMDINDKVFNT